MSNDYRNIISDYFPHLNEQPYTQWQQFPISSYSLSPEDQFIFCFCEFAISGYFVEMGSHINWLLFGIIVLMRVVTGINTPLLCRIESYFTVCICPILRILDSLMGVALLSLSNCDE
jgi:hypothetical protein